MRQCSIEKKNHVDTQDAGKPLDFNLLRISPEFLIDQIRHKKCFTIFL